MNSKTIRKASALVVFAMLTAVTLAQAATNYWTNSLGGSYAVGGNWGSGSVPAGADLVYFTNNASYQVTYGAVNGAAQYYNATSGVVTNNLTGSTVSLGSAPQWLGVGDILGSTATVVQVGSGQFSANNTFIGNAGVGSYTISGSAAWLRSAIGLYVGYTNGSSGSSLLITNGALFTGNQIGIGTYATANNTAIVSGTGTIWTNTGGTIGLVVGYTNAASNILRIEDGARLISQKQLDLGLWKGSSNNTVTVIGTNSYLEVGATSGYLQIGQGDNNNTLIVSNGGSLRVLQPFYVGGTAGANTTNNNTIITGAGSIVSNTSTLFVGYAGGHHNTLQIDNGGRMISAGSLDLGFSTGASNNTVLVTGSNSYLDVASNSGSYLQIGQGGHNNAVIVSNGGFLRVSKQLYVGGTAGTVTTNNNLIITGAGSIVSNTSPMAVGWSGMGNTLRIEDGAQMASVVTGPNSSSLGIIVGRNAGASNNTIVVTGSNTVWGISASGTTPEFTLGYAANAGGNTMIVSNGGKVRFDGQYFEIANGNANNSLTITGPGSTLSNPAANFYVGYNSGANGNNRLVIDNGGQFYGSNVIMGAFATATGNRLQVLSGGLLDANILNNSFNASSTISNFGGTYQFSIANPTISRNGSNIVITNGTVSFRNVAAADVKGNWTGTRLTNILFQGDNVFRLNNSSNATTAQDYTFNTGLGATNYVGLELVNGNTLWRSAQLTIGSGGTFLASNTIGTVAAIVTNLGNIEVKNSMMTWSSNVVISGRYFSDPSTNTYIGDVTVGQSGTLAGGAGDLFDFKKSLFINATNNIGFQLANSAVMFSGGGMHTNALTGADLGSNITAYASAFELENNFAYGELHLGSVTDQVCFTCGNIPTIASNGLYIGWLDLLGNSALVTNLHVDAGITLYYDATDTRNAYLNNLSYALTDCNFVEGGGFLMPVIPEPSLLTLFGFTGLAFLRRLRRE